MGTYVSYVARSGAEQQINEAYRLATGNSSAFLIYTDEVIEAEIAYVHSETAEPAVHHMRAWLKTVKDWNEAFRVFSPGRGQFKLQFGDDEDREQLLAQRGRDLQFILDHRFLFERIDGLEDVRANGLTSSTADVLERGSPRIHGAEVLGPAALEYEGLPPLCRARPAGHVGSMHLAYSKAPTVENWDEVKTNVIPWLPGSPTVWQRCEKLATQLDGADYGLVGRYRGDETPTAFLVRKALSEEEFASH